jgi:hypothetical protein
MNAGKTLHRRSAENKEFTLAEANATLPLVGAILSDLVSLFREVNERSQRLLLLLDGKATSARDPYQEELVQIEKEVEKDSRRLNEYVQELRDLGVEPRDGPSGQVDFPAVINGRKVFFCWQLGEPQVQYWHELRQEFPTRQLLPPEAVLDGDRRGPRGNVSPN